MAPLPFTDSGARIAFDAVLAIILLLEMRVRVRSRLNRHGERSDRNSFALLYVLAAVGAVGGFALAGWHAAAIPAFRWPIFVFGVAAMALGTALRQWAVALLGQFFTVDVRVHPGQTVVDHGPYRWVRHPAYSGLLITFVGIGLALGNWASLAVLIILPTAGLAVRIRVEERALLEGLGEPYRRFAATRARLVPGVW